MSEDTKIQEPHEILLLVATLGNESLLKTKAAKLHTYSIDYLASESVTTDSIEEWRQLKHSKREKENEGRINDGSDASHKCIYLHTSDIGGQRDRKNRANASFHIASCKRKYNQLY